MANHEVDNSEQLTHAGSDSNFEWLLPGTEALIECFDNWIATTSSQRRHIKHPAYVCTAAEDVTIAALLATVAIKRSDAHQLADLLSIKRT